MTLAKTLIESFARPAESEMTFIEKRIYEAEDIFKALIVKWYLFIPFYGMFVEIIK